MSGAERCVNPRCDSYPEIHEGSCTTGPVNHVDKEIYVPLDPERPHALKMTKLPEATVRHEIKGRPPLPLFVLYCPDESKIHGHLLRLDDEDGETYHKIAEGLHEDMAALMDYLHEGEEALHGPR